MSTKTAFQMWKDGPQDEDYEVWLVNSFVKLRRWCECMIGGLQCVADWPEHIPDPLDLKHHALGSLTDPKAENEQSTCIPEMFRKMFPDADV